MISPFAQYKQSLLEINARKEDKQILMNNMIKHVHFAIYSLPLQLQKHTSYVSYLHEYEARPRSCKQKDKKSILLSSAGIVMTLRDRHVTFSSKLHIYTYSDSYIKKGFAIKMD